MINLLLNIKVMIKHYDVFFYNMCYDVYYYLIKFQLKTLPMHGERKGQIVLDDNLNQRT